MNWKEDVFTKLSSIKKSSSNKKNSGPLLVQVKLCTAIMGMNVTIYQKDEHQPTSRSSYTTLEHVAKRCFKHLHRQLFKCVHLCSVNNSQKLEIT